MTGVRKLVINRNLCRGDQIILKRQEKPQKKKRIGLVVKAQAVKGGTAAISIKIREGVIKASGSEGIESRKDKVRRGKKRDQI